MSCCSIKPPRWSRRKEARPQEILCAALSVFVEKGFASTKMEDIARRAGVTKGTPYLYFKNKEDIFKGVVREGLLPKLDEIEQLSAAHEGSAMALLEKIIRHWWGEVGATHLSGLSKLIVSEAGNFPELAQFYYEEVVIRGKAVFGQAIQLGIQRGEFKPISIEYAIRIVFSPLFASMIWRHSMARFDPTELNMDEFIEVWLGILEKGLSQ